MRHYRFNRWLHHIKGDFTLVQFARALQSSPKSVSGWLYEYKVPRAPQLTHLCQRISEIQDRPAEIIWLEMYYVLVTEKQHVQMARQDT